MGAMLAGFSEPIARGPCLVGLPALVGLKLFCGKLPQLESCPLASSSSAAWARCTLLCLRMRPAEVAHAVAHAHVSVHMRQRGPALSPASAAVCGVLWSGL